MHRRQFMAGASGLAATVVAGGAWAGEPVVTDVSGSTVIVAARNLDETRTLSYRVRKGRSRHVLFDAPRNASKEASVEVVSDSNECRVQVSPHAGGSGQETPAWRGTSDGATRRSRGRTTAAHTTS